LTLALALTLTLVSALSFTVTLSIMVSIRKVKQGFHLRDHRKQSQYDKEKVGLVAAGLCIGVLFVVLMNTMAGEKEIPVQLRERNSKAHPVLLETHNQNKPMRDTFNALALDIIDTLDCAKLFNDTIQSQQQGGWNGDGDDGDGADGKDFETGQNRRRRRLDEMQHGDDGGFENNNNNNADEKEGEGGSDDDKGEGEEEEEEEKWGKEAVGNQWGNTAMDDAPPMDDYGAGSNNYDGYMDITAKHLFCLAAMQDTPQEMKDEVNCDATDSKRQTLLDLWSAARAQMSQDLLLKVLGLAKEQKGQTLLDATYNLWAHDNDSGLEFLLNSMNSDKDVDNGGLHGLSESLGEGKLFVDVGSCLGIATLAITNKYPGTKIVSLEPASPNWLLQQMNLRCNLEHNVFKKIHVILAGVGPNTDDEDNMMAKLMWRPTSTTSARAWTPSSEHQEDDVELVVRLRRLRSILAEADVFGTPIDVLNVDCEGCEYNLIPALGEEEFDAIPTVMGGVHWGYIPTSKLPSSERGRQTHQRLCQHENIAKGTKECCAFPQLKVKSSVPGEVLVQDKQGFPPQDSTVMDVIQEGLCDDFDTWAAEHFLNDVKDDWGWFELTSQA
jgi:FkbM family methyltransferase